MNFKPLFVCAIAVSLAPIVLAQKPADKGSSKPAEAAAQKPAEKPAQKPAEKTSSKPAEKPGDKILTQEELLKQIQELTSSLPARTKPDSTTNPPAPTARPTVVAPAPVDPNAPDAGKDAAKPQKPPTVITSDKVTFDNKANLAIFIEDVYVDGPDYKVSCDKLTAYLRHDDKTKPAAPAAGVPAPGTPAPTPAATPVSQPAGTPAAGAADAPEPKKTRGLERAIAESTSGRRVVITQPKIDADGKVSYTVGKADKATFDSNTNDVVLYGSPEIIQDSQSIVAIDPATVMTLNRDGHMRATGRTKSTFQGDMESK